MFPKFCVFNFRFCFQQVDTSLPDDSMPVQAHHYFHNYHNPPSAGPSDGESAGTDTPRSLSPQSGSDHLDSSFGSSGLPSSLPLGAFITPSPGLEKGAVSPDRGAGSPDRGLRMQSQAASESARLNLIKLSQIRSAFSTRASGSPSNHADGHYSHSHHIPKSHKQTIGQLFALKKRLKAEAMEKDFEQEEGEDNPANDNNNRSDAADANTTDCQVEVKINGHHVKEEPMDTYSPADSPQESTKVSSNFGHLCLLNPCH